MITITILNGKTDTCIRYYYPDMKFADYYKKIAALSKVENLPHIKVYVNGQYFGKYEDSKNTVFELSYMKPEKLELVWQNDKLTTVYHYKPTITKHL